MESLSTRVRGWLRAEILRFGRRQKEGPSEALRRVAEEWWALSRFPVLEFRDGVTGRRAGLRGGPDVWEVIMVWQEYRPDRSALADHFGGRVSEDALSQALEYYDRFPDEVDARLEENERIATRLGGGVGRG